MTPTKARGRPKKDTSKTRQSATKRPNTGAVKKQPAKNKTAPRNSRQTQNEKKSKKSKSQSVDASQASLAASDSEETDEDDYPAPPNNPNFSYLKVRTRRVPHDVVRLHWGPPSESAQQRVRDLLTVAKRGVANTAKTAKRAEEMTAAIDPIMHRLLKNLHRMRVPPKIKEESFDLEKLLERSRSLEAQLTASLHSIELLKAEIEYEESELVGAEERLASMKKNAKKEEDLWKKQAKKIESMIDVKSDLRLLEDSPDAIGLVEQEDMVDSMFEDDYGDMELTPILSQLRSHLESIQFNSMQVQGIPDALADVSLALEWILQR